LDAAARRNIYRVAMRDLREVMSGEFRITSV